MFSMSVLRVLFVLAFFSFLLLCRMSQLRTVPWGFEARSFKTKSKVIRTNSSHKATYAVRTVEISASPSEF